MQNLINKYEACKLYEKNVIKKGYKFSSNLKEARRAVRTAAEEIANFSQVILNRKYHKIASKIEPIISEFKQRENIKTFLLSLSVTPFRQGESRRFLTKDETHIILRHVNTFVK